MSITYDQLPAYLRDDAKSATCTRCGRKTWTTAAFGEPCGMPQPTGGACAGTFALPSGILEGRKG